MNIQDISIIQNDSRYSIEREYCGYETKRWVVRFCGDFLASSEHKTLCYLKAVNHNKERV